MRDLTLLMGLVAWSRSRTADRKEEARDDDYSVSFRLVLARSDCNVSRSHATRDSVSRLGLGTNAMILDTTTTMTTTTSTTVAMTMI